MSFDTTMFIRHTCKIFLSFFLCIFIGKKKNLHSFSSVEFSYLEQFSSFACAIDLYRFTTIFIRHTCYFLSFFNFFKFLPLTIVQEKIFVQFLFFVNLV